MRVHSSSSSLPSRTDGAMRLACPRSLLDAKGDLAMSVADVLDVLNGAAMPRLFSALYYLVFVPARATCT